MKIYPIPGTDRVVLEGRSVHGVFRVEWRVRGDGSGVLVDESLKNASESARRPGPAFANPPTPPRVYIWAGIRWYGEPLPLYLAALPFRAIARAAWPRGLKPSLKRRGCGCVKRLKDRTSRTR